MRAYVGFRFVFRFGICRIVQGSVAYCDGTGQANWFIGHGSGCGKKIDSVRRRDKQLI